jgi:hypothetical protein
MIIDGSLTPLNLSTTLRASRQRETPARCDDDYSLRKVQNVRVDSPEISTAVIVTRAYRSPLASSTLPTRTTFSAPTSTGSLICRSLK